MREELVGFVNKYHTQLTTELDMDKEQLIIAITEVVLEPTTEGASYRALEFALNLANIPITDKLGLHQCIGDMLRDEVVKLALSLRQLEDKYNSVLENQKRERASAKGIHNYLETLRKAVKDKGGDKDAI